MVVVADTVLSTERDKASRIILRLMVIVVIIAMVVNLIMKIFSVLKIKKLKFETNVPFHGMITLNERKIECHDGNL